MILFELPAFILYTLHQISQLIIPSVEAKLKFHYREIIVVLFPI